MTWGNGKARSIWLSASLVVLLIPRSFLIGQIRSANGGDEARAAAIFKTVRQSPLALRAFLQEMPKGGDLHLHLAGAVYAESLIRQAAADGLCVDRREITLTARCEDGAVTVSNAFKDQSLYTALVDAFSMRDFVPSAGVSGHDQFFASFGRFLAVNATTHLGDWVDEVASRAAAQNEQYLEVMQTPTLTTAVNLGNSVGWTGRLAETREALLSRGLRENVDTVRKEFDEGEARRQELEKCGTDNELPGCKVEVRYLFQVLRGFPPQHVFAQMVLGFEVASVDPRVVGINLVMPEDWYVPMTEYHRQMEMLDYLHRIYPKVHISLHAGELAPGLVPPDGLTFHIREAVNVGHAERIGHGVDVMYEHDARRLLRQMAAQHIAVEVSLTSNDVILGIKGKEHPLPVYRSAGVPIVLCTDDEGVARIDLTHEYQRAADEFDLTYRELKEMAGSSIRYSFLPDTEKSIEEKQLADRFAVFERRILTREYFQSPGRQDSPAGHR